MAADVFLIEQLDCQRGQIVFIEPPRDCRRLFCLSHAATAVSAIMA
jgi:hypothetical protein